MAAPRKVVLAILDGLTPTMLERAVESGSAPALAHLARHGSYTRAVSTFPSLTPVCLASIATGAHGDVHGIPHLVWYHREERRFVEYGSSFRAALAASFPRAVRDTIYGLNHAHLSRRAVTLYEAVEDAGLVPAAINITCYRGRTWHRPTVPGARGAWGPRRFFFYSLFESEATGVPYAAAVRNRARGSVDDYAARVGRWLVARDGFDCLVFYLSDYDYASHALGPDAAFDALARCDAALGGLMDAAGGWDEFLARYAVVLCADHGQTRVERAVRLESSFGGLELLRRRALRPEVAIGASNRAGHVYRLPRCRESVRELAERLDAEPAAEVVLFREGDEAVARREREELRFRRGPDGGFELSGDAALLDHPDGLARAWAALLNPHAGDVLVSAAEGVEFTDLGGGHHVGGGSHGSLAAGDSLVPVLTVGIEGRPESITDLAPLALRHLGVALPPYARPLPRAA